MDTDILRFVIVGITGALICVLLKQYRPEIAFVCALVTGFIILAGCLTPLGNIIAEIYELSDTYNINVSHIGTVIKVIVIAYISQFSAEMCRDSGQGAIASKIEFCTKILILIYSLPIVKALLSMLVSILQ